MEEEWDEADGEGERERGNGRVLRLLEFCQFYLPIALDSLAPTKASPKLKGVSPSISLSVGVEHGLNSTIQSGIPKQKV